MIPGLGKCPGEEKGYPLQYSGLENSLDSITHGVTKSQTQVSAFHFRLTFPFLLYLRSTFGLFITAASLADLGKWGLKCPQGPSLKEKSGHKSSTDTVSLHLSHAVRFSHVHK